MYYKILKGFKGLDDVPGPMVIPFIGSTVAVRSKENGKYENKWLFMPLNLKNYRQLHNYSKFAQAIWEGS